MSEDPELDRVRMVLDYMPAEVYDDVPEGERDVLESLDRRLSRTVAVRRREQVQVVVERSADDAERVREYLRREDDDVDRDVVLEPVGTPEEVEGRSMELDLDDPPPVYEPEEDSGDVDEERLRRVPGEDEDWPDPDDRYEDLYGDEAVDDDLAAYREPDEGAWPETGDEPEGPATWSEEPLGEDPQPAWPTADDEDVPPAWPDAPDLDEERAGEDLGGFEEVGSAEPDDEVDLGWPGEGETGSEWDPDDTGLEWPGEADETPDESGFEPLGEDEPEGDDLGWPGEAETTMDEPPSEARRERDRWVAESFGEADDDPEPPEPDLEAEAGPETAEGEDPDDTDTITKTFPPGTPREEIERWAREKGYRIRRIEEEDAED